MAIMASEMPAAISPYSMAVAAVSSAKNRRKVFRGLIMGLEKLTIRRRALADF
jgi:hypothetical protein